MPNFVLYLPDAARPLGGTSLRILGTFASQFFCRLSALRKHWFNSVPSRSSIFLSRKRQKGVALPGGKDPES
jgi:hypothetical protein